MGLGNWVKRKIEGDPEAKRIKQEKENQIREVREKALFEGRLKGAKVAAKREGYRSEFKPKSSKGSGFFNALGSVGGSSTFVNPFTVGGGSSRRAPRKRRNSSRNRGEYILVRKTSRKSNRNRKHKSSRNSDSFIV